jgi:voltage-dependent potassium channel beta subunit
MTMEYRRLGNAGLKVSALSLGSWVTFGNQVDRNLAVDCMAAAYEQGCNFFDNAETYARGESELLMGAALKQLAWDRDSYSVSSKAFFGRVSDPRPTQRGLSRKHLYEACDQALSRLQLDYLDLYYCHRPDPETPIVETVRAMNELIARGKVLYWGTSEWSAAELLEAHRVAQELHLIAPQMEQPQYNMFTRERCEVEYKELYELGMGTTIYSPLASGILTGKYKDGIPEGSRLGVKGYEWLRDLLQSKDWEGSLQKTEELRAVAGDLGGTVAQLALAWCLVNPNISSVITGASRASQVEENFAALGLLEKLTSDVLEAIERILNNKPTSA